MTAVVPHIYKLKERYIKVICYFQIIFFYCLLRPCWSKILTGDIDQALKHLRLNTDIGTWFTPQNPKWPYLKFRLGTYIPPAKRASQLVQDFWGGLNLALKFSSHNFHTKNLYSLGRCFEYKSESTGSNKIYCTYPVCSISSFKQHFTYLYMWRHVWLGRTLGAETLRSS